MPERKSERAQTDLLKRTAGLVCDEADDVAAEIGRQVGGSLPDAVSDAMGGELRIAAFATLTQFLGMLREDIDPAEARLAPEMTRLVREFVHHGVDLTAVLHTFRVGHAVIWSVWLDELRRECAGPVELGDAISVASQLQFAYVNALSDHAAEEYRSEREQWTRSADAVRVGAVNSILAGDDVDLEVAGARLGYELRREHVAVVLWGDPGSVDADLDELRRVARAIATATGCPGTLLIPFGEHMLAAWIGGAPAPSAPEFDAIALDALEGTGVRAAVGSTGEGLEGFRRGHREATWAREVALAASGRDRLLVRYSDVALAAIALCAPEQSAGFVVRELGQLASDDDECRKLAFTLRVYLEEGSSLDRAARRLGVHKNTVLNRVKRAHEAMGRALDDRPLELHVALAFAAYLRGEIPGSTRCATSTRSDPPTGS